MTPYQYAANNPLLFIDVNGDSLDLLQIAQNLQEKASEHQQLATKNFKKSLEFVSGIAYGGGIQVKTGPLKITLEAVPLKQELKANLNGDVSFTESSRGGVKLSFGNDINVGLHGESFSSTSLDNKTVGGTTMTLGIFTLREGTQLQSSNTAVGMNVTAGIFSAGINVDLKNVGMGVGHQVASYGYSTAARTINALFTLKQITF